MDNKIFLERELGARWLASPMCDCVPNWPVISGLMKPVMRYLNVFEPFYKFYFTIRAIYIT